MGLTELQTAQAQEAAQVAAVAQAQADLATSVTAEIARVEAAIAALKGSSIKPEDLDPITAALTTSTTNLTGVATALQSAKAALDAEQSLQVVQP